MPYSEKMGSATLTMSGKTRDECKRKLYEMYGEDYTLLSTRPKLKGGILGFFQREEVEVEYVLTEKRARQDQGYYSAQNPQRLSASPESEFMRNQDAILHRMGESSEFSAVQLSQMSKVVQTQMTDFYKHIQKNDQIKHASIRRIEELLEQNEFTASYIADISGRMQDISLNMLDDFEKVQSTVVDWIGESIKIAPEPPFHCPSVIVIVGPTGVGKTTTVAKMSADIILSAKDYNDHHPDSPRPQPKVHLITADTVRVAAAEQIQHYADIMNLRVASVKNAEELERLYKDFGESYDYIFIDTAGYSPNDVEHIAKMHRSLDVRGMRPHVYLAVMAGTKARDLERIMRNYESFDYKSVIVTKCDETSYFGNIISVLWEKKKSISWITYGQEVIRTMRRAHPAWFLTRLEGFSVDRAHIDDKFGKESLEEK